MKGWKRALDKFVREWKGKDFVEAALLTGSYALGLQTPHSDIDVYIILSDNVSWRERGDALVDGFLIEYFANPVRQIRWYFEDEHSRNKRNTARMFLIGKALFDQTGIIETLRTEAERYMEKPFPEPDPVKVELAKYILRDALNSLKESGEMQSPGYTYLYQLTLKEALESYARFLRTEIPPASKVYRLFSDGTFRRVYLFPDFPDGEFVGLFLRAMEEVGNENIEALINHVLERMGGFDIGRWKLRTEAEV